MPRASRGGQSARARTAFTIDTYQRVLPGMQADTATVFSDLVAGVIPPAAPLTGVADDE